MFHFDNKTCLLKKENFFEQNFKASNDRNVLTFARCPWIYAIQTINQKPTTWMIFIIKFTNKCTYFVFLWVFFSLSHKTVCMYCMFTVQLAVSLSKNLFRRARSHISHDNFRKNSFENSREENMRNLLYPKLYAEKIKFKELSNCTHPPTYSYKSIR